MDQQLGSPGHWSLWPGPASFLPGAVAESAQVSHPSVAPRNSSCLSRAASLVSGLGSAVDGHALAPPLLGKFRPGGSEGLTGSSSAPTTGPDAFTRQCVTCGRLGSSLLSLAPQPHTLPCGFLLPSASHG